MRTLNLGILAHVDAGKTTLSERLLYTAGAIDHVGSVDAGTTQTDSLDLERERGITIRSAVASFLVGDLAVNLVDTPGHPDFIAEVERVLGVLDGAILVVSAVEGVQPQTPLLFRALQRLHVPTLLFVNKVDRSGADPDAVLAAMARRLSPGVVPMAAVRDAGTRDATVVPFGAGDETHRARLTEVLAEHDDDDPARLRRRRSGPPVRATAGGTRRPDAARAGSIPCSSARRHTASAWTRCSPASTSSSPAWSAIRRPTSRAACSRSSAPPRASASRTCASTRARCGRASASGWAAARTPSRPRSRCSRPPARRAGTRSPPARWRRSEGWAPCGWATRSASRRPGDVATARFPRPALEAVVYPLRPDDAGSLRAALAQLAEQDPLIDVRQDDHRHEIAVSLYGEVQKEVIQATLEREYGIAADFRETTTVCIERPAGVGEAEEVIRAKTHTNITGRSSPLSTNPFKATLALRIEPAPFGSGTAFRAEVEPRLVPLYLFKTPDMFLAQMEAFVHEALEEGLAGWQVTDCRVTMTDCGYASPETSTADFRRLTQLVLATASRGRARGSASRSRTSASRCRASRHPACCPRSAGSAAA